MGTSLFYVWFVCRAGIGSTPCETATLKHNRGQSQTSRIEISEYLQTHRANIEQLQNNSKSHNWLDLIRDSVFQNRVQEKERKKQEVKLISSGLVINSSM